MAAAEILCYLLKRSMNDNIKA